jgi:hypothetical protein
MLKLRPEHLTAFEAQVVRLFTSRVVAHVKAVWPAESAEWLVPGRDHGTVSRLQRQAQCESSLYDR